MKFGSGGGAGPGSSEWAEFDSIDVGILELLQENCKRPLAQIGEKVGLSAPAVMERIHKLEEAGVISGYHARLDSRLLGKDVTAFIGVSLDHPRRIEVFERDLAGVPEVVESHHVTGEYTLLLKVKTRSTATLERLIDWVRSLEGVTRTETTVVLSTQLESPRLALDLEPGTERSRRGTAGARGKRAQRRQEGRSQEDAS